MSASGVYGAPNHALHLTPDWVLVRYRSPALDGGRSERDRYVSP